MGWWVGLVMAAFAQAPTPQASIGLVPVQRAAGDLTVLVRSDGQVLVDDQLTPDPGITEAVRARLAANPQRLVVVAADGGAPYSRVAQVMTLVQWAQPAHLALELDGMKPLGDGPPIGGTVTQLGGLTDDEMRALRPKRWKFEQNPYGNTSGFTAYALELGEWKVGLGTISVGALPRTQIGTAAALDAAGAFNIYAKSNLVRYGPLDGALLMQYYSVPQWALNLFSDAASNAIGAGQDTIEARGWYLGLGALASVQLAKPWTVHVSGYYARPGASGTLQFDALPAILFPGLDIPATQGELVGKVNGDGVIVNLASDLRFNRRDSVWVWGRVPIYARARGLVSADSLGVDGLDQVDLIVAYGDMLNPADTYSVAFGYMASWRNLEARVGWGVSAKLLEPIWALQAFDLSYHFGGPTRREERQIRAGYHEQKRVQKDQAEVQKGPPPPPVSPKAPAPAPP